jgi:hypothetical protein
VRRGLHLRQQLSARIAGRHRELEDMLKLR